MTIRALQRSTSVVLIACVLFGGCTRSTLDDQVGRPPRLADWPEDLDEAGCADALASELSDFAAALEHWPGLWQHAAEQGGKLLTGM